MQSYHPLVSIVIPVYNGSDYLREAITSALAQRYDRIEVLVVDDGSCDGGQTEAIARSFGDRIRYIHKENGGSSSALNEGIRQMQGEWFSWLSHDDLYTPDKVGAQIAYIQETGLADSPDFAHHIFFTGADWIDATGACIRRARPRALRRLADKIEGMPDALPWIAEPTRFSFHGCGCLIHRSAFADVGPFDESLRLCNDVDMWYRLYAGGYRLHLLPAPLVQGRVHAGQISRSIGFSYHNPEQDMYWQRSLACLRGRAPGDAHLLYRFGRNAYRKTRYIEGRQAFSLAGAARPAWRPFLFFSRLYLRAHAGLVAWLKRLYLRIKM